MYAQERKEQEKIHLLRFFFPQLDIHVRESVHIQISSKLFISSGLSSVPTCIFLVFLPLSVDLLLVQVTFGST